MLLIVGKKSTLRSSKYLQDTHPEFDIIPKRNNKVTTQKVYAYKFHEQASETSYSVMIWWRGRPDCLVNRFAWLQSSDALVVDVKRKISAQCAWCCLFWCNPSWAVRCKLRCLQRSSSGHQRWDKDCRSFKCGPLLLSTKSIPELLHVRWEFQHG